jgi:hypothetical protein
MSMGVVHLLYELLTASQIDETYGWELFGFEFQNPIWFLTPWTIIGLIFFLWAGWYFPAKQEEKRKLYREAFAQDNEM